MKLSAGKRIRRRKPENLDIHRACRVCLNATGECGLFAMNSTAKELLDQMFDIKVESNTEWKICVPCLKSIEKAAEFRKMAKNSDQRVKLLLGKPIMESVGTAHSVPVQETTMELGPRDCPTPTVIETATKSSSGRDSAKLSPTEIQKKRRTVYSAFLFDRKRGKRNIACTSPGCTRLFIRDLDLRRHIKLTHEKNRVTPSTSASTPLSVSTPVSAVVVDPPPTVPSTSVLVSTPAAAPSQPKQRAPERMPKKISQAPKRLSIPHVMISHKNPPIPKRLSLPHPGASTNSSRTTTPVLVSAQTYSNFGLKDLRIKLVRCPDKPQVYTKVEPKKPERVLPCPYCDKDFTLSSLSQHILSCTGQDEPLLKKIKTEPPDTHTPTLVIPAHATIPSPNLTAPLSEPRPNTSASFTSIAAAHECDTCHEKFHLLAQLLKHRNTHHSQSGGSVTPTVPQPPRRQAAIDAATAFVELNKCDHCGKEFSERWLLVRHLNVVHGIKRSPQMGKIKKTQRRHSLPVALAFTPKKVNGNYVCCGTTYANRSSFNSHKSVKHPDQLNLRPFFCQICHTKVLGRKALSHHYKTVHEGESVATNTCNVCGKEYAGVYSIYYHKKAAHPELFVDDNELNNETSAANAEV